MSAEDDNISGGCLCGAVQFEVSGPLRDIMMCHCTMCQKSSGHHFAATAASSDDLHITEQGSLTWFKSSAHAERGFCKDCGSNLFWRMFNRNTTSILVGSFDGDVKLPTFGHLFVSEKKNYYTLDANIPQYATYPKEK